MLVPPELLGVAMPFLIVQPLVENACGTESRRRRVAGGGTVSLFAYDESDHVRIELEDDGPGIDPVLLEARLSGLAAEGVDSGFGMRSVDERLRAVYGDSYGLFVETAPGAGTKIVLRLPKYHPQVHA